MPVPDPGARTFCPCDWSGVLYTIGGLSEWVSVRILSSDSSYLPSADLLMTEMKQSLTTSIAAGVGGFYTHYSLKNAVLKTVISMKYFCKQQ